MICRILTSFAVLVLVCSFDAADAQLFKGRAQRQSGGGNFGGGNSVQQQPQQRSGGLFQKGRERREANQSGGQQSNSSNDQPQQKSGLFNRNRSIGQPKYSNQPVKQGGLFARAKERKLEAQQQQNSQNRSYSNNNSQSASSYVRSNQKVTGASNLFQQPPTRQTGGTTSAPVAQSAFDPPTSTQKSRLAATVPDSLTPQSQPARAQLPTLVSAAAEAKRSAPQSRKNKAAPAALRSQIAARPKPLPVAVDAARLKERAPAPPNVQPTSNLPDLSQPKVEASAAVLA